MSKGGAIDNVEFAKSGRRLDGRLGLEELSRAGDLLLAADLEYSLQGLVGRRGEFLLRLRLAGSVGMRCERCLEQVTLPIAQDATFELRRSEAEIRPDDLLDDERDFLVFDRAMAVADLVEDELILCIPAAPKHASCEAAGSMVRDEGRRHVFGALAALKK